MSAIIFDAFGCQPEVRQVPDPAPSSRGVVIDVKASGLCRSDWHGWKGHAPEISLPHVPGHEFAGVVSAVGIQAGKLQPSRLLGDGLSLAGAIPVLTAMNRQARDGIAIIDARA